MENDDDYRENQVSRLLDNFWTAASSRNVLRTLSVSHADNLPG
jgi:hypothetical protein